MKRQPTDALAAVLDALVHDDVDVADVLADLVADCATATSAATVALLAVDSSGELSLLAADSHRASQLEMLQIQREQGPCVDVIASNSHLWVTGPDAMVERWGTVGSAIVESGFMAVEAYPMRWHGRALGGLNLFHADPSGAPVGSVAQAFADLATLLVVQSQPPSADQVRARLHEALSARGVVEQAKGVLAYTMGVELGEAYDELFRRARDTGRPLTQVAHELIAEVVDRRR